MYELLKHKLISVQSECLLSLPPSKFSVGTSDSSTFGVPDELERHVRHAPAVCNGLHLLRDVLLRRAPDVDVVAIARRVVTRNCFPEVVGSVQA